MVSAYPLSKNRLKIHLHLVFSYPHQRMFFPVLFSASFPSGVTLPPLPPALHTPAHHKDCSSQPWHNEFRPGSLLHKGHIQSFRPSLPHTTSAHHGISEQEPLRRPHRMAARS